MNYQQFIVEVKEKVTFILGESRNIQIHTALKNNGKERTGLTIFDQQVNISPTIYLEEYYQQFQSGSTIDWIAESICELYKEVKFEHTWDANAIQDFSRAQSKLGYKLIHANKNELLLSTLPHMTYLDFAIVFYILFEADSSGTATIPVTNELLKLWDKTIEDLYEIAHSNMPTLLPADFKPMHVVICELLGKPYSNSASDNPMYVLTNTLRSFGACCILYDGILSDIGRQLGENYYVLPSSIHEVIIVPESKSPDFEDLNDMIVEINETQVADEEILSEHAYYYDCKKNQLFSAL